MPMADREKVLEPTKDVHPSQSFVKEVADEAATAEEIRHGFPILWAHLQECKECRESLTELMGLAYQHGQQDGHAQEAETQEVITATAVAGILAVLLLASGLLIWQSMGGEAAVNRVYASVGPAVANIQVQSNGTKGSGVVFDEQGYILTNYHVVRDAQSDQDLVVQLPNLGEVPATLIGYDVPTDLAVLKVDAPPDSLTVAQFGTSDSVEVGDLAIAIGNPFGLSQSLTVGRISSVARKLMSSDPYAPDVGGVLQTDAAINPGNSGGPLLNTAGNVIGITTRIESPSQGSVGVGFAIPSDTALEVAHEIMDRGYVRRPFLGVAGRPITPQLADTLDLPVEQGLLVQDIHPESPAKLLGLDAGFQTVETRFGSVEKDGDVILSIGGQPVSTQDDLNRQIAQYEIGDEVEMEVLQDGQRMSLDITLIERPWEMWAKDQSGEEAEISTN